MDGRHGPAAKGDLDHFSGSLRAEFHPATVWRKGERQNRDPELIRPFMGEGRPGARLAFSRLPPVMSDPRVHRLVDLLTVIAAAFLAIPHLDV